VIVSTFIYDNVRLMLLSKTDRFPDGLANSSGHPGKYLMTHVRPAVFVGVDNRALNVSMGPNA